MLQVVPLIVEPSEVRYFNVVARYSLFLLQ